MDVIKELASSVGINMVYMGTILKIIGIAYIAEFGAQICRDAGEGPLPLKLNCAKILIMVLAVPIVVAVLTMLIKLVP